MYVVSGEEQMLRIVLGLNGEEVVGDWRKLHNEELHDLYFFSKQYSGDLIKEDVMVRARGT